MEEKDDKQEHFEEMDQDEPKQKKKRSSLNIKTLITFILLISAIIIIIFLYKYLPSNTKEQNILDTEPNTKFLVTLGSSKLGGSVIEYLLKKNVLPKNIITTVRSLKKGEKWKEKELK